MNNAVWNVVADLIESLAGGWLSLGWQRQTGGEKACDEKSVARYSKCLVFSSGEDDFNITKYKGEWNEWRGTSVRVNTESLLRENQAYHTHEVSSYTKNA